MDTAQPVPAAETDAIANAASAFKSFTMEEPIAQPRDETGKFAAVEPEDEPDAVEAEPEEDDDGEEAAEAQPMPPSWPADQADHWAQLPAETQEFVLAREAERERAVNAKFQESANARKEAQTEREQAKAVRTQLADQLDMLAAAIQPVKPDARAYGAGTGQYNREAYDFALAEYETQSAALAQLTEQRNAIKAQADQEAATSFETWKQEHEARFAPRLLADVPELTDATKADPLIRELVKYAIDAGVPEDVFAEDQQKYITSAQLHLLWKAAQYDKLRANPPQAKPKPASPAVKPGVSSPRSAQKAAQRARISDRLASEGSIAAGAAMWKSVMKG